MSSQINVDTIVDKAGTGGANVKIANNSVTVSEGGSATTTTVQGLIKLWSTVEMDNSNNIPDSFNSSGITDGGTGTPHFNFTNNMSNSASYVFSGAGEDATMFCEQGSASDARTDSLQTGLVKTRNREFDAGVKDGHHMIMVAGDLA